MANFDAQIQALAGTADQTEMDDWAADGVKEIINILPEELKIECATITSLTSTTPMDLDATGKIFHVTRENADSGYHIGCRKVNPILAGSASDSTSIHYVTSTDPIYWIESDTGGDPKLFVKPDPTASQPARVHHVSFPTVDVSAVSSIVNFPDEAEYLVVLYVAVKVLQNKMNEMGSLTAIDTTALGAITTELNKVDDIIVEASSKIDEYYTSIGDIDDTTELWDNTNKRFKVIRDALLLAENLIDNDQPNSNYDAYANLADIDGAMGAIDAHLTDGEAILTNDPTSGDISTALGLIKTAVDQAATAAGKFLTADSDSVFGDESTFLTNDSQLARVKDALDNAEKIIDDGANSPTGNAAGDAATYLYTEEDTELVQGALAIAGSEINRAQAHIAEWVAIGDMRVKEVQIALQEADGYAKEVQARLSYAKAYSEAAIARRAEGEGRIAQLNATVSVANQELQRAQVAISEINTLMASYKIELEGVPMYLQEATSYISQAQGYIGEAKVRMERESQKYQWYQSQQIKLQQDYDKGIQMLISQVIPQPTKERAKE
jgi:hypothetical protein